MNSDTTVSPPPVAERRASSPQPSGAAVPSDKTPKAHSRSLWILWLIIVCVLTGVAALVTYRLKASAIANSSSKRGASNAGIPVEAATAFRGDLPVYVDGLLGTVTALQTVTVHTRVNGELVKVAYVEGQIVKQGDLLVQIDPNPYKAALETAQGALLRDQAMLLNAQLDLKRYKQAPMAYTPQQIDTQQALVDQDAGIVKSDQGAVDTAQVNLNYCTITSPVTGRIGLRQVDEGNIVNSTDATPIAVITQLQPITIIYPIQQDKIPDVVTRSDKIPPLQVTAFDRLQEIATGKLIAIDSQVDTTTGMVKLRAQFDNTDNALFPNQLLGGRLLVNTIRHVVLVPSEAVQTGPDFSFVYVVKPDNTVQVRKVKVGNDAIVDGQDLTEIQEGLAANEVVVTNGVDKLTDGAKVDATRSATTRPTTRHSGTGGSTTRPGGVHVRRSLTNDSSQQGTSFNGNSQ
jgi:multidrug efflux system membrane fusion protein